MDYILIGDSGHAKVIEDSIVANGDRVIAKLDDKYKEHFMEGAYKKGPISILSSIYQPPIKLIVAIGNNEIRQKIVRQLNLPSEYYGKVIHPSAIISPSVTIGNGSVIMANVVINAQATIGEHVIINTSTVVEHDNTIDNYVHLSPGTVSTGNVHISEGVHIGAKCVIIPSIHIQRWTTIGAGSTVTKDIEEHVVAFGTPAKVMRKKDV